MMPRFNLYYVPFPEQIRGIIRGAVQCKQNSYLVLIDSSLTDEQQSFSLKHELSHILLGHFDYDSESYLANIEKVEAEANQYAEQMTDDEFQYIMSYAGKIKRITEEVL